MVCRFGRAIPDVQSAANCSRAARAIRRPGWVARQPERRSSCVARSKQDAGSGLGYRRRPTNCRLAVADHCVSDHYLTLAPDSRLDAGLGDYRRTCTVRTLRVMRSNRNWCNSSDLGVFLSSKPVNWNGRVAIRDLSRRSRGDFQLHELVDLIPLAPFSWRGEGGSLLWGTPPHPTARASPLQPFPGFPRSDILACGRPSSVRSYAHTEQVPLNLNSYESVVDLAMLFALR